MIHKISLIISLMAIICISSCGGDDETKEPVFHVFLLLGQSNMVGYPEPAAEDMTEDSRVLVLGYDNCNATGRVKNEWDEAAPPLHVCNGGGLGPGDYFGKTLINDLPEGDTIGMVPCAINGQAIEAFFKGTGRYEIILERARIAQESGGVISGILFHQGESNSGQTLWPGNVAQFVADLKADLQLDDTVPFLAGEMAYSGDCAPHNEQVAKLPDLIPNAYVISAEGLEVDETDTAWGLHFGRDAQVEFGKRYAATMKTAMGL